MNADEDINKNKKSLELQEFPSAALMNVINKDNAFINSKGTKTHIETIKAITFTVKTVFVFFID